MNRRPVGTGQSERLEQLAKSTHGGLVGGHLLGAVYHLTDPERDLGNWLCAGIHIGAGAFSAVSVWRHIKGGKL